jgi:HEPN domain-containing protein
MNAKDIINNWQDESKADLESAIVYIERSRVIHGLFLCHLVIEKSLKAIIVSISGKAAPKSHDIFQLAKNANFTFTDKDSLFINSLIKYKIQGRYPDNSNDIPSKEKSETILKQTKILMQKLHKMI